MIGPENPIFPVLRVFRKPFLPRKRLAWWVPQVGLGSTEEARTMPTALAGLDWLEPEEFPAWRRRLELERRAHKLTLHRQKALGTLLAFWGARACSHPTRPWRSWQACPRAR